MRMGHWDPMTASSDKSRFNYFCSTQRSTAQHNRTMSFTHYYIKILRAKEQQIDT